MIPRDRCRGPLAESWRPGTAPGPRLAAAWAVRRPAFVKVTGVDVVRVASACASTALTILRERGVPRGPVLANLPRSTVEFIVVRGTADVWPALRLTRCVADAVMRCPAPSVTSGSGLTPVAGRVWLTPPGPGAPDATDADQLAEAVTVALLRHARMRAGVEP
ncbi:hypothetical protein [Streptomyces sp. JW3]|uniref:hypothetical protein n=1 Tax=Streptomyces sp. JW3 TaxID=3456955 RepID=UPI003FA4C45E